MIIFELTCYMISFVYVLLIIQYWIGWHKTESLQPKNRHSVKNDVFLSVIVPFRNEENNIQSLINCLSLQDYPENLYEIILIDDHSQDKTMEIITNQTQIKDNLKIIKNQNGEQGKKAALINGIHKARGEIIVQTDADCTMMSSWLSTIASFYKTHEPEMILAPVIVKSNHKALQSFQEFENAALITSTCGSAFYNRPILANGANLIYKKEVINTSRNPFRKEIPSGDDMFLVLTLARKRNHRIKFLKSAEAPVYTNACKTLNQLKHQKKRWLQKGKYYKDKNITLNGGIIISANLAVLVALLFSLITSDWLLFLVIFAAKAAADSLVILSSMLFFKRTLSLHLFLLAHIVYPIYAVSLMLFAFTGKFKWKERVYKKNIKPT
ncbi:MAG: glycosyltransferase [Bacteroidales bacterium]